MFSVLNPARMRPTTYCRSGLVPVLVSPDSRPAAIKPKSGRTVACNLCRSTVSRQAAEIDHFGNEMNWFAGVVRGRAPNVSPGEEGLQDMRILYAILHSVNSSGSAVKTAFGYERVYDPAVTVGIRTSI